ncbi:hypothetical protein BCV69DRAFT_298873 [Microstroma glucosiphilum]|uniref:Uncharacterized protein n=1 Tax=Pseudomicrostroma glucosiphilum TaxID=1684307 RepID=A0A316U767_9BASI|nr:hypothetical protein BCV69DRAFT_298873 [Pseudomicrostroma glucosiphilum]PWN21089.1 hypothetical protein BCV69DRAFT_298873 [Pseudomicrostroma glucosiphilum]
MAGTPGTTSPPYPRRQSGSGALCTLAFLASLFFAFICPINVARADASPPPHHLVYARRQHDGQASVALEARKGHSTSRTSSSSSSSSARPAVTASSSKNTSSSSSIKLTLPDSFVQCGSANIGIDSVIGSRDASLLGNTSDKVQDASWLNLRIRVSNKKRAHVDLDLPSDTSSWTWPYVDLPAGTSFTLMVSSMTNQTMEQVEEGPTNASSTLTSPNTSISTTIISNKKRGASADDADAEGADDTILAHSLARSNVIAGVLNNTSCLPVGTDSDDDGSNSSTHHGNIAPSSSGPSHAVTIVAGFLGGLVGLFVAILAALAWHRRKENRRRCLQGEGGANSLDHTHGGRIGDRRSVPIATWDGQYRNSPRGGWSYMTSLVPGLSMGEPPGFNSPGPSPIDGAFSMFRGRRRAGPTSRRREEGEEDLPTYGKSEEEIKGLPSYEPGMGLRNLSATANGHRQYQEMTQERYRDDADDSYHEEHRLTAIREQEEPDSAVQSPATVLHYFPSGPSRPYSTLDLVNIHLPARAPAAEVASSVTMNNVARRNTSRSDRGGSAAAAPDVSSSTSAISLDPFASPDDITSHHTQARRPHIQRDGSHRPSNAPRPHDPTAGRTNLEEADEYDSRAPLL